MCLELISGIRWGKIILAAVVYVIISQVVRTIEASLTMSFYLDPAYFGVWSKLMMPKAGPPPPNFFILSLILSLIIGVVLAVFYERIKKVLPSKSALGRACDYTAIVSVLTLVLSYFPMYLLINLPLNLIVVWFVSTVAIFYLSALVFVKILG